MDNSYERLKAEVVRLRDEGRIGSTPTAEERANWAYGTTKIENDAVTLEMAVEAVEEADKSS
jgi:hypothetical protein